MVERYAVVVDTFVPVGPRRTFEGAVQQIAERIRLGELNEGDRLPAERELAVAMQISRILGPLRVSIRRLEEQHDQTPRRDALPAQRRR